MELFDLKQLMIETADIAVRRYIKAVKPKSDELTQRAAFRKYGEAWVKNNDHEFTRKRKGRAKNSPIIYSDSELAALYNKDRLLTQFNDFAMQAGSSNLPPAK